MKLRTPAFVAIALVVVFTGEALSGTVIKCRIQALDASAVPGDLTMYLEKDRARIEFKNEETRQTAIYTKDGGDPVLWLIDQNAWTYRELKKKDVKKVRERAADELDAIEDEIRKVPAEERDATRSQMRRGLSRLEEIAHPKNVDKVSVKKKDRVRVREWECVDYASYYDGKIHYEYSVAEWKDVGIGYDEVKVLVELRKHFGDIAAELGFVTLWEEDVAGFPVQMQTYQGGVEMEAMHMGDVTRGDLDPKLFKVSNNYDKHPFLESSREGSGFIYTLIGGGGGGSPASAVQKANAACKKPDHNQGYSP